VILISNEDGTRHELTTDKHGRWRKSGVRAGMWTIEARADGYTGRSITVQVYPLGENNPINIRLSPTLESFLSKGDSLYQQKKYAEALQEYQRVLSENPDLYLAHERIGLCYAKLNDLDNAIKAFKSLLDKDPQSQETLFNISIIYFQKGDLDEGMKYFKQLDEKRLTDPQLFFDIGIALFRKRKIDMAIDFFNKCLALDPNYVGAYYQLALANINKGNMEEAKKNFRKVIELAPESEQAASAKKMLETIK